MPVRLEAWGGGSTEKPFRTLSMSSLSVSVMLDPLEGICLPRQRFYQVNIPF
jgi:hypothetical protein